MPRLQFWRGRGAWSHMWICCVPSGLWWMGWTDADLCLESITATDLLRKQRSSWRRETPTSRVLPQWSGGGDVRHGASVIETTRSWRQTDPCVTSHHSWCVKPWISKGYEPAKELKIWFHETADVKHLPHQRDQKKNPSLSFSSALPGSTVVMVIVYAASHY